MVLVRTDDLMAMLRVQPFEVEVAYDPSSVSLAVAALGVIGTGDTLDDAVDDLLTELRAYVKRFFANPLRYFAAGQGDRAGSLLAFALADDAAQRRMVIGGAESAPAAEAALVGA